MSLGLAAFYVAHVWYCLAFRVLDRELWFCFVGLAAFFLAVTVPLALSDQWITVSWAIQIATAAVTALVVCLIWRRPTASALKAASLAIGTVMVTPYVLTYDLTILSTFSCVGGTPTRISRSPPRSTVTPAIP